MHLAYENCIFKRKSVFDDQNYDELQSSHVIMNEKVHTQVINVF